MRNPPPDFDLGDHVTIKPMEDCPARVIAMELDHDGWTVVVRYFQNGEVKTLKAFPDEIDLVGAKPLAAAQVIRWEDRNWPHAAPVNGLRESGPA